MDIVGRVWPRHGHRGRPLNSVVSCHLKLLLSTVVIAIAESAATLAGADTRVTLSPSDQLIATGDTPTFAVRVEAIGEPARIIRFNGRDDLRISYARLIVSRDGKRVDLVPFISDPGPIGDGDIITLRPGTNVSFTHRGEPYPLRELPPGEYSAKILFDSTFVGGERIESNSVILRVKGK